MIILSQFFSLNNSVHPCTPESCRRESMCVCINFEENEINEKDVCAYFHSSVRSSLFRAVSGGSLK